MNKERIHIYDQYRLQDSKPGECLPIQTLTQRARNIDPDFGFAVKDEVENMVLNELLERKPDKGETLIFLTELGFDEMNSN